nr:hypothetical protein [Morchella crassipes]
MLEKLNLEWTRGPLDNYIDDTRKDSNNLNSVAFYDNVDVQKKLIIKENENKSGIYRWTNKYTGDTYIGQSTNLSARFIHYFNISYLTSKKQLIISRASQPTPPNPPLGGPVGGLHGFSWGPPPSTAATQLLRSERGGAAPPLASPPPTGGDASPLLLLLGRARVARPPKQKWNRPRPSFLFSIKNWKEESWKRAKRGGEMHLSSYGERRWWLWGGVPKRTLSSLMRGGARGGGFPNLSSWVPKGYPRGEGCEWRGGGKRGGIFSRGPLLPPQPQSSPIARSSSPALLAKIFAGEGDAAPPLSLPPLFKLGDPPLPTLGLRPRLANPPSPLGGPVGGLHGFSWGPPQHSSHPAATQREGGAAPPLASPPPYGGDASPLLLLLGRARVARPPKQKWNRPALLFLLIFF